MQVIPVLSPAPLAARLTRGLAALMGQSLVNTNRPASGFAEAGRIIQMVLNFWGLSATIFLQVALIAIPAQPPPLSPGRLRFNLVVNLHHNCIPTSINIPERF